MGLPSMHRHDVHDHATLDDTSLDAPLDEFEDEPLRRYVQVRRTTRPVLRFVPEERRAWMLDAVGLHREFDELFQGLTDDDGLVPFRARVTMLWGSDAPVVQEYLAQLRVHSPDEWAAGFEERHLAEWYRVLIAGYLEPVRGFASPAAMKDDLPDLGWSPSEARRLTWGRELAELAHEYGSEESATALDLLMRVGNKGWLSQDDIDGYRQKFCAMPRSSFKGAQDLIPLVEDAFEVLSLAAASPDRVLLLPGA